MLKIAFLPFIISSEEKSGVIKISPRKIDRVSLIIFCTRYIADFMIKNNTTKYGLIAKIFHWTTFLFLIVQIPFGFYLSGLEFSMQKADFENYHSLSGVLIFYVILARLIWKLLNPSPKSWAYTQPL